jgi:predicted phage terminase large subunit-like protein
VREKLNYPSLKRRVIEQARKVQCGFDSDRVQGVGDLVYPRSRGSNENIPYPISFTAEIDKVTRMSAQSAKIEAGHVFLPRRAEWLDDFRAELLQFPYGRYDDQVDSMSQFLNWIDRRHRNRMWIFPPEL